MEGSVHNTSMFLPVYILFELSKLYVNLKLNHQGKVKGKYALPSPLSGFPALADSLAYLER
jgi:hypothetical protein